MWIRKSLMMPLFWTVALSAQPDARDIMRQALANYGRNYQIGLTYTYLERQDFRVIKSDGSVDSSSSEIYDVTPLEGSAYYRLLKKNDEPLPSDKERKEEQKLRKSIEKRVRESQSQREKRIEKAERDREQDKDSSEELLKIYDFRLLGEQAVHGRDAFLIAGEPNGHKGRLGWNPILAKCRAKFWIDKADAQLSKAEFEMLDTTRLVKVLSIQPGTHFFLEWVLVNQEAWFLQHVLVDSRMGVVGAKRHLQYEFTWSNFRKFKTDSRVVSTEEVK